MDGANENVTKINAQIESKIKKQRKEISTEPVNELKEDPLIIKKNKSV